MMIIKNLSFYWILRINGSNHTKKKEREREKEGFRKDVCMVVVISSWRPKSAATVQRYTHTQWGGDEENKGKGGCILFCLLGDGKEIKLIELNSIALHACVANCHARFFLSFLPFHTCMGLKHYSSSYPIIFFIKSKYWIIFKIILKEQDK